MVQKETVLTALLAIRCCMLIALKDYAGEFAFRQVELLDSRRNFV